MATTLMWQPTLIWQVKQLVKRDAIKMAQLADAELQKKVEAFKWQQKLELEGLKLRIERGRSEHKGHWTQVCGEVVWGII